MFYRVCFIVSDMDESVSRYENVKAQAYPAMLVTGGLFDPRVAYWEPTKWVFFDHFSVEFRCYLVFFLPFSWHFESYSGGILYHNVIDCYVSCRISQYFDSYFDCFSTSIVLFFLQFSNCGLI